jgi:hypothetical protein
VRGCGHGGTSLILTGRLTILDFDALKTIAEFDASYLYLEKKPR